MKMTVCIVTKNRQSLFTKCFQSVLVQKRKPEEIVVIDSSDSRMSLPGKRNSMPIITHVHNPLLSTYAARSAAILRATGDLIFFVDDDCILASDTTQKMIKHFLENRRIDLVMGDIINRDPQNPYGLIQDYFYRIWMKEHFMGASSFAQFPNGMPLHFDIVCIKKSLLTKVIFDIKTLAFFNDDDIDTGVQLFRMSKNLYFDKTITATYQPRATLIPLLLRNLYNGFSNHYILDRRDINVKNVPHGISRGFKVREMKQVLKSISSFQTKIVFFLTLPAYLFFYKLGWAYYWYWNALRQIRAK